jgi:hypothetical protein
MARHEVFDLMHLKGQYEEKTHIQAAPANEARRKFRIATFDHLNTPLTPRAAPP